MDNWSANMYFDNQPNDIARNNALYFSGYDTGMWLKPPQAGYPWSALFKFNAGISIGDECASSGANPCTANLANTQIYNNLIVGFRLGVAEYAEGKLSNPHGLKSTLIANNTIILPSVAPPNTYTAGLFLRDNGTANADSAIVNNVVYAFGRSEPVIWYQGLGPDPGVFIDHNAYFNASTSHAFWNGFLLVDKYDLVQWQRDVKADAHSLFEAPKLADVKRLMSGGLAPYNYRDAKPALGSPLLGSGQSLSSTFDTNFDGAQRRGAWTIGAF
jgi:hypothetical protein